MMFASLCKWQEEQIVNSYNPIIIGEVKPLYCYKMKKYGFNISKYGFTC